MKTAKEAQVVTETEKARSEIERLWGQAAVLRPGPKAKHSPRAIAKVGIALADRDGLAALSMRSVASEVGISPMGLYTYLPSKADLVEIMIDQVYGQLDRSFEGCSGWQERLTVVAESNWQAVMRHNWLADVEGHRPVLGPNTIAKYDFELQALEGLGFSDVTMDLVLNAILNYVRGAAKAKLDAISAAVRSGIGDARWWSVRAPLLADVMRDSYPLAQRVGAAAGAQYDGPSDPDASFRFGLKLMLDGISAKYAVTDNW
jgi:AcrR family transcriptional regulator